MRVDVFIYLVAFPMAFHWRESGPNGRSGHIVALQSHLASLFFFAVFKYMHTRCFTIARNFKRSQGRASGRPFTRDYPHFVLKDILAYIEYQPSHTTICRKRFSTTINYKKRDLIRFNLLSFDKETLINNW